MLGFYEIRSFRKKIETKEDVKQVKNYLMIGINERL